MQFKQAVHSSSLATQGGTYPNSFISSEGSNTSLGQTKIQIPQSSTPLHVFRKIVIPDIFHIQKFSLDNLIVSKKEADYIKETVVSQIEPLKRSP